MGRQTFHTDKAPDAIGSYSQACRAGNTVYLSGQIPLLPDKGELIDADISGQVRQVFDNVAAVAEACGGSLDQVVKLTVYLTDLGNFATVNEVMAEYFSTPFPARAALGVSALPKGAQVEVDAIVHLD